MTDADLFNYDEHAQAGAQDMTEDSSLLADEVPVTKEHRQRAARCFAQIHVRGEVLSSVFMDDLAKAFAEFEWEILSPPTTTVQGMEESEEICALCGTSPEDHHTLRDCFAKYKAAQDDAHNQVTDHLGSELESLREGYRRLDANWDALHNAGINAFRTVLSLPDATIPEMVETIERLLRPAPPEAPRVYNVYWDEESTFVVARSTEDAAFVYAESSGEEVSFDALEWSRYPSEKPIRIKCYGPQHPQAWKIAPADEEGEHIITVTRSAAEWSLRVGRGFLCTSDY